MQSSRERLQSRVPVNFKIKVFWSLEDAAQPWHDLERTGAAFLFQSFDWLSHWYRIVPDKSALQVCIVLLEDPSGHSLMLLPLGIEKGRHISRLVWLGMPTADYMAPILAKDFSSRFKVGDFEHTWTRIIEKLPRFDVVHLERQPEVILDQQNPFITLNCEKGSYSAHHTELVGDWDSYYHGKIGAKSRSTTRRKMRRLEERGKLEFLMASEDEEVDRIMPELVRQKTSDLREQGHDPVLGSEEILDFYREIAKTFRKDGRAVISVFRVGTRTAAANFSVIYGGRFYYLIPWFEKGDLARYSPGNILLEYLIRFSFKTDVRVFDFTIGDEAYKSRWCEKTIKLYNCLEGRSAKGVAYVLVRRNSVRARRALRKWDALRRLVQRIRRIARSRGR